MRKFKHLLAVAGCITCSVAFVACGGNDGDTDKKAEIRTQIKKMLSKPVAVQTHLLDSPNLVKLYFENFAK